MAASPFVEQLQRFARSRLFSEYGMVLVLLGLCVFFSFATITDQAASGPAAASQVHKLIQKDFGSEVSVVIASGATPEERSFTEALTEQLQAEGIQVVATITGDPRDARETLERLSTTNTRVDVLACSRTAAGWLVFSGLSTDFPGLGDPKLLQPRTYLFPTFLTRDNLLNISNQISVIAIVAIGMTMVIIAGGIDLSVGSLIAFSAVLTAYCIRDLGGGKEANALALLICSLLAIAATGGLGAFSGIMVTRFSIPPFIATLAMMLIASGFAYILAEGQSIAEAPQAFDWLGRGADVFGLPNAVLLMLILYALAHLLMTRHKMGRHIYAVGGNPEAARLSGVPVARVVLLTYILSGLLSGLGGVIFASLYVSGSPTYGNIYELYVIAAVVVGGTSLSGGEGRMFGTLIGAFTIAVIWNGMNLTGVESYTQKVVLGGVILASVMLDRLRHAKWAG